MTASAIVWLDRLIDRGLIEQISDIHLDYIADTPPKLNVRIRHAGDLVDWPGLEGADARGVISRIKSVAQVGSGTIRKPEEGRYPHRVGAGSLGEELTVSEYDEQTAAFPRSDLRLVVLPTIRGEKHVLRLPSIPRTPKITELGLSESNLERVAGLFGWPNGLVLFAGPVGAGKTTSMYSALDYLGGPGKAVYSVEDPVERTLDNVDQIEVNNEAGNTFAAVLRSIRRSDLQVLMIGEIRDSETAYSAIEISIAGARVVSSIHANDSIASVEAMLALSQATPHQIMQSLRGVVSQRLVKRIHVQCRGLGCEACRQTGVDGRLAVHEVLTVTQEFSEAIIHQASRHELVNIAHAGGMISLRADAQRRLDAGETTPAYLAEVLGTSSP